MPNEKTSTHQYELLVTLLQDKPDIARNYTKRAPEAVAAFWDEVTDKLNQLGPRQRDAGGWKKVWSDYKTYIKKKLTANQKENSGTGGGPFKQKSFTPLEDAVIALVKINCSVNGIGAKSFGMGYELGPASEPSSRNLSRNTNQAGTSGYQAGTNQDAENEDAAVTQEGSDREEGVDRQGGAGNTTTRPRKALSSIQLLTKQVETQASFFVEIKSCLQETSKALKEATDSLKDTAVNLKRVYRSIDDVCDVEKKKLKEMQSHNAEMRRIAVGKLELKKKILELELSKANKMLE